MSKNVYRYILLCSALLAVLLPISQRVSAQIPLKFAAEDKKPPYSFMTGNTPQGYLSDLSDILSRIMKRKISLELMGWGKCLEDLEKGTIDAIAGVLKDEKNEKQFDFSQPLCEVEYAIFVVETNRHITSLRFLDGTLVGVYRESPALEKLEDHKKIRLIKTASILEALNKLKNHEVTAVVAEKNAVLYLLDKVNIENIHISAPVGELIYPYCIAVKKGNRELLDEINGGISTMSRTGALHRLNRRWFGSYLVKAFPWQDVLFMTAKITALIILLLVFLWIISLRTTIRNKTQEIQKMSHEMIEKEKLTVLGKMAGQIAHELRTPLGIIKNSAYLLRNQDPADKKTFEKRLNMLEEKIKLSTDILESILSYSRVKAEVPTEVAVKDCVAKVLSNMDIPHGIKIDVKEDAIIPARVYMDFHQLYSVLRNLVLNALQAMGETGTLTIHTFLSDRDKKVSIRIGDTGQGIAESARNKIFNLFYSTKSSGTGLGLPISKSIIEANQGDLHLDESSEKGTCFVITLPSAKTAR